MNTNPVMIYCGQELGEPGMDEEGFSGRDGRTTIFDYWSLKSLRDWNNNGKFDGAGLSEEQKYLRQTYSKILHLAKEEPAIVKGEFYDLMYANSSNPYFNTHRQYAFLRKYDNEVILIVANFDKSEQKVRVEIPSDAFNVLGFEDNKAARQIDLFSGFETVSTLTESWPYQVVIPGYSARIIKFVY